MLRKAGEADDGHTRAVSRSAISESARHRGGTKAARHGDRRDGDACGGLNSEEYSVPVEGDDKQRQSLATMIVGR